MIDLIKKRCQRLVERRQQRITESQMRGSSMKQDEDINDVTNDELWDD